MNREKILLLGLVLWTVFFILLAAVAAVIVSPQVWATLGLVSLLGGTTDSLAVWVSIVRIAGTALVLGAVLLALQRSLFSRLGFSKFEFLLWGWAPAVGAWVAAKRCLQGAEADWVACLEPILVTWVLPLGFIGLGRLFAKPLGAIPISEESGRRSPTYYLIVCSLLGSVGWAFLLYLFSLLGPWNVWTLWAPVTIAAVFGVVWLARDLGHLTSEATARHGDRPESWAILFVLLLILTAVVELSFLPPDESDELRYHLSIPKRYLEAGGRIEIPDRSFSRFPLGMETLFALPTSLDWLRPPDSRLSLVSGAKFIHAWFFILCLMTVYLASRRFSQTDTPLWGPYIFATVGFAPVLAAWAFVDFGAAFGWLASILFTGFYFDTGTDSRKFKSAMVGLVGIALGWGLMVKYTSLAWIVILLAFWMTASIARRNVSLKSLVLLGVIPFILAGPWLVLNAIETGNPFYPLLASVFGAGFEGVQKGFYDWHAGMKGNLNAFGDLSLPHKLYDLLSLPFRAALFPWDFENNPIGALIPCLLPPFFYGIWRRKGERLGIAFISLSLFLLWGLTYRDPRFAIPLWGVYAALAGAGFSAMLRKCSGQGAAVVRYSLIGFLLFLGLGQSDEVFRRYGNYREWIARSRPPQEYLEARLPFHDVIREVERLRKQEANPTHLLLLGMEQSYYFDSPIRGADYFDGPWLAQIAKNSSTLEEMSDKIREQDIDWIFVNRDTLENNGFNVARGALFCLDPDEAEEELNKVRKTRLTGLETSPAFRRMHAWLIRHPGFFEQPLASVKPTQVPLTDRYREWMDWPEMRGMSVKELPNRRYSLLIPRRG